MRGWGGRSSCTGSEGGGAGWLSWDEMAWELVDWIVSNEMRWSRVACIQTVAGNDEEFCMLLRGTTELLALITGWSGKEALSPHAGVAFLERESGGKRKETGRAQSIHVSLLKHMR